MSTGSTQSEDVAILGGAAPSTPKPIAAKTNAAIATVPFCVFRNTIPSPYGKCLKIWLLAGHGRGSTENASVCVRPRWTDHAELAKAPPVSSAQSRIHVIH